VVVRPKYTCDGLDLSPELSWTGVSAEAVSTVVLVDDSSTVQGAFTHWLVYDLPLMITSFEEGRGGPHTEIAGGGFQSPTTDFGFLGYAGPCPPEGEIHSYFVHVYALDTEVGFFQATREEVVTAMEGHIIGHGTLRGLYQRTPPSEGGIVFGNTPTP
jgi:Raf kinase inhibitor-like YbhB/YbcL family protein